MNKFPIEVKYDDTGHITFINFFPDEKNDNVLAHFGVPGMKWGKRGGGRSGPSSQDSAKASKLINRSKAHGVKSLSNDELKKLNTRMDLEKKHKDLNPNTIKKGQAIITASLAIAGTAIAVHKIATSPMARSGAKIIANVASKAIKDGTGQHVLRVAATGAKHLT